ncbi:ATP-dependent DNA helicase [Salinirubellus salinus]|uniref:ATP-dependent DNA helicase n=2 Tax=Salinirubellus salinus TaxID=1364945 RepID=A0A9E7R856_9EURY|nr:ATP-dependent DNA helicase [Salinirubellus salinus]UWM56874.1 ATP-dependent DNA helicase [Salinirubellus salinus]
MGRIREALDEERNVLFEGACGTGKTLASLVPALDYAREADKTVVIVTNVHQQMRQFVTDARAITRTEPIRAVVFRGKASMCHIDVGYEECQALRDTTREVVEKEEDLRSLEAREAELLDASQSGNEEAAEARGAVMSELESVQQELETIQEDRNVCDRFYRNLVGDTDAFYEWLYEDVRTPDDVYEWAEREGFCGYELLKEGMDGVDLVVANYHHLLDPFVREQFFRWLGRDPEDVIAVFDEAHNVEETAREKASKSLAEVTLDGALSELEDVEDYRAEAAENVVRAFRDALVATYEDGMTEFERESVGDDWEDLTVDREEGRDALTVDFLQRYTGDGYDRDLETALELGATLDKRYEQAYKDGETATRKECRVLQAASFVESWMRDGKKAGQYPVVSVRRDETGGLRGRAELYACLPREVTAPLFGELHATVLMSATLRPFDVVEDVLGVPDPVTMAYGDPFPKERRRTYAVDVPALYARNRDDPGVQETVTQVLTDSIRMTPGNTLAFFPSYAEAERYYHRVETDATPYLDRPGVRAEELRQRFVEDDHAVLFTSLWGTLTEGVSYDGDDARTVCVVGVPYPHLDDRMEAVQRAYRGAFGDGGNGHEDPGWEYAVEIPTVRKTRQALGRVVRSPEDFGARVLVDERYTTSEAADLGQYSVNGTFPEEERTELIDVRPGKLKFAMLNFYGDVDAWGPEGPPAP